MCFSKNFILLVWARFKRHMKFKSFFEKDPDVWNYSTIVDQSSPEAMQKNNSSLDKYEVRDKKKKSLTTSIEFPV